MTWKIYDENEDQIMFKQVENEDDELYIRVLTVPRDLVEQIEKGIK